MSVENQEKSSKKDENIGLLFGYHKEMYRDKQKKVPILTQCCAVYCARGSITSWTISFSIGLVIIGVLCTLYGYFLPMMYLSLSSEINANMTLVNKDKKYFETEAKSLNEIYSEKDAFVISGLVILFIGGLMMSLSLLVPLCVGRSIERIPISTGISVKNELGGATARMTENCSNSYMEETYQ